MAVDRKTPTTGNFGPSIDGEDYASAVNEEVEALWARAAVWLDNVSGTDTITADADPALLAYSRNNQYNFIPANTNIGPTTLAINGLSARSVRDIDGVALGGGELVAGRLMKLQDDGTNLRIMNRPPESASDSVASVATQTFTASGTYTPNALMIFCRVRMVGPGGGGGGVDNSVQKVGGCGGGGEYAEGYFDSTTIGASQTVTIGAQGSAGSTGGSNGGAGGTTSLGSLLTAVGGSGGAGTTDSGGTVVNSGGAGGTGGTGGFLRVPGQPGSIGQAQTVDVTNFSIRAGHGGSTPLGFGPSQPTSPTAGAGVAGQSYGAGGSGGATSSSTGQAGGVGGPSAIFIEEYLRAP